MQSHHRSGANAPVFVLAYLLRSHRYIPSPRRGRQHLAPGASPEIGTCAPLDPSPKGAAVRLSEHAWGRTEERTEGTGETIEWSRRWWASIGEPPRPRAPRTHDDGEPSLLRVRRNGTGIRRQFDCSRRCSQSTRCLKKSMWSQSLRGPGGSPAICPTWSR